MLPAILFGDLKEKTRDTCTKTASLVWSFFPREEDICSKICTVWRRVQWEERGCFIFFSCRSQDIFAIPPVLESKSREKPWHQSCPFWFVFTAWMLLELYRNSNCALLCFLVIFGARMCADTRKVGEGLLTEIGSPCALKTGLIWNGHREMMDDEWVVSHEGWWMLFPPNFPFKAFLTVKHVTCQDD